MADGAFTCACQNHVTPGSVPPAGVCGWLEKFGKSCASCPGAATGRRLSTVPSAAAADGLSYGYSAFESRNSTPGTAMNITLQQQQQRRHLTSLLPVNPGLPPGSKCKDYSPERLCAAQPETWSKDPLYMVYTMWSVFKCRNRWQQTSRSGTSTSMFDAVCGCNPDVNSTLWSGAT